MSSNLFPGRIRNNLKTTSLDSPELVVMAAGIGSRYGGLKQIEPVGPNGEIILDYSVFDALRAGFKKVTFVINRKIEYDFKSRIQKTIEPHLETEYIFQDIHNLPPAFILPPGRTKPWGTAHAVLGCNEVVNNSFVVINADDFYGRAAYQLLFNYLKQTSARKETDHFCMAGYILKKTLSKSGYVSRGICEVDQDGYLTAVHEKSHLKMTDGFVQSGEKGNEWNSISPDSVVSMNMWGFTPLIFKYLKEGFNQFLDKNKDNLEKAEYYLPELINKLLIDEKVRVKVLPTKELWYGITFKSDKGRIEEAVQNFIKQDIYPEKLWDND